MSSIGNPLAYELHLFGRFCAYQKVIEIGRNVFPVVHAISLYKVIFQGHFFCRVYSLRTIIPILFLYVPGFRVTIFLFAGGDINSYVWPLTIIQCHVIGQLRGKPKRNFKNCIYKWRSLIILHVLYPSKNLFKHESF